MDCTLSEHTKESFSASVNDVHRLVRASGQLAQLATDLRTIERCAVPDRTEVAATGHCGCEPARITADASPTFDTARDLDPLTINLLTEERLRDRMQRARRASLKASAAARRLAARLLKRSPGDKDADGEAPAAGSHAVWRLASGQQRKLVEALARNGVDHDDAEAAVRASMQSDAVTAAAVLAGVKRVVAAGDALARTPGAAADPSIPPEADSVGGARTATSASALTVEAVAAVVSAAVAFVGSLIDVLPDLFNASDDDRARDLINSSSCAALRAMSPRQHFDLVDAMVRGPTGDDDELAILRLLDCLTCAQVQQLASRFGPNGIELIDEFQGVEFDRLMIRLQECGVVSLGAWGDDTTRRFVRLASCETLQRLSLSQVRLLLRNLFSGHTGDDDEQAILKLVRCQSCDRRRALVRMAGLSVSDFDDEVDGAEWRELRRLFQQCGITV